MTESISKLEDDIKKWKSIRRKVVRPLEKNIAYRPMFNVDFFREALLYRFIELAETTIILFRANHLVSAIISARSVQETLAMMWFVNDKLKSLSITEDLSTFLKKMDRLSFGWSGDDQFPEKINILTCIDSVDKIMEGSFRKNYDFLSEFAHPNYSGVIGAYTKPNHQTLDVDLSCYPRSMVRKKEIIVSTLSGSLLLLVPITETYETLIDKGLDVCISIHKQGELENIFYKKT